MALDLRIAETELDAVLIFRAFKNMHAEGGLPGRVDDHKTLSNVLRMVFGPDSCILMVMDGSELAGMCALVKEGYWFSANDFCLSDKGFYVLPRFRNDDETFRKLLEAAQQAGDDLGLPVHLTIFNAKRKRGPRTAWERVGVTLGWINHGAVMAHTQEN